MYLCGRTLTLSIVLASLANGRPLDASPPRDLIPRAKSYNVINVDGGTSITDPATQQPTKTVEVIDAGPTVTATVIEVIPSPGATSSGSSNTSSVSSKATSSPCSTSTSSSSSATITPSPQVITIVVTKDDGPTSYYDNGLWHTYYRVKTFEAVTTATASLLSSTTGVLPTLASASASYNQTSN